MIVHPRAPGLLLFTQHDHALLSGRMTEQLDGKLIAKPSSAATEGISLHDCGWPLHDDRPTLNAQGYPLHVFESPVEVATQVWSASAKRAANQKPYAGLLVSLHVLNLSAMAALHRTSPREVFELNKFQHQQIELQEKLRVELGMRIDRPLNLGLAAPGTSAKEDQLLFDYHLLRAMDQLSLALLCDEHLFDSLDGVDPRPGGTPFSVRLQTPKPFRARLRPWPFATDVLKFSVPCRRVSSQPFGDVEQFRQIYQRAAVEQVELTLSQAA